MTTEIEVFHFENDKDSFENFANINGFTWWSARLFMKCLGYSKWGIFNKVINKAMIACNALDIALLENFIPTEVLIDGKPSPDFKLSRFACYLIAMNGDTRITQVAKAQVYFATIAGVIYDSQTEVQNVKRVRRREKISEKEATLSGVARTAGVENYPFFQNSGYRGMYNKNMSELKTMRGIDLHRSLLDYMGDYELAANLFRISLTEMKIQNEGLHGQKELEEAAQIAGKEVRKTIIRTVKITPEELHKYEDIKEVKKRLKTTNKKLKKIPAKKSKKLQ